MGSCCSSDRVNPEADSGHELENGSGGRSPTAKSRASLVSNESLASKRNRSCTDIFFLIIMTIFLISLLGLIIYCAVNGDIYRIVNGYDSCGNVCGMVTEQDDVNFDCKGKNLTAKPYLLIREGGKSVEEPFQQVNLHRECVASCSNYDGFKVLLNRCVPQQNQEVVNSIFSKTGIADFLQEASEDLQVCWRETVYMCLCALLFSAVILLLFRFVAGFIIWLVLGLVAVASIAGTIYLWLRWRTLKDERNRNLEAETEEDQSTVTKRKVTATLVFAVIATIATIIILLIILVMRKRIQLVVQLFKEAGKAVSSMPFILFQPFLTFLTLAVIVALWLVCTICVESAGFLAYTYNVQNLEYHKDTTMKFTRWYNLLALFWFCQFAISCQQMVIAGAVAKWFFTRNKDNLGWPIVTSYYTLVRYHLGSIALGSLVIALVQLIRSAIAAVEAYTRDSENAITKCLFKTCHCCLYCFEKILQFLSRNAYIIIAIHGYPFCKSGREAFKLLSSNALRVAAINSVGDFVLILAKVLVVIATVLCGMEMLKGNESIQHMWVPIMLAGLFAFFVAHAFISVYEMTIDTIFLCFCEDCERNDGLTKPYYMSRGLMEFVENSKKALEVHDSTAGKEWSGASTRSVK